MAQQISKMNLFAQVFKEWTIEILIKCFDITFTELRTKMLRVISTHHIL